MFYEKKLVFRAGTIPYYIENGVVQMMFMRPSNPEFGGDEFQLAKGRVEENESTRDAALREAKEELGLFLGNVSAVEEVGLFMGRTTVYVAKVIDKEMFGEPSFETDGVAWMTLEEFERSGRPLHRPVVRSAYHKIMMMEGME